MNTKADNPPTVREAGLDLVLLQDALDLAEGAILLFAICEEGTWRQQLMQRLEEHQKAQEREIIRVELSPEYPDLIGTLSSWYDLMFSTAPSSADSVLRDQPLSPVIFVDINRLDRAGLDLSYLPLDFPTRQEVEAARLALRTLNMQREPLARLGSPIVFWLSRLTLMQVVRHAADLFAARSGIFYLEMPQPPAEYARMVSIQAEMMHLLDRTSCTFLPPEELARRTALYEKRLAREQSAEKPYWPGIAWTARELADLYREMGDLARSAEYRKQAVKVYRRLTGEHPEDFSPLLAVTLRELGVALSDLGRREEALAATQEATDLYRELAEAAPQAFLPDLATSLNNLGAMLSALGRREEALAATQEAADLYRGLAQADPQAFLPDLAGSLNNLGNTLSALGRREEALAATQEAVSIRRGLAQAAPQAFLPDLAGSLNNLGMMLSALGRREEALAAMQKVVSIRRGLAKAAPQAFRPDLAMSLNNLGNTLSALGRREEALAATQEAADLYRELAEAAPQAFRPDLARSLNNLGNRLSDLGRREEALAATQEAVSIRRELAEAAPQTFRPDLARSLNNLGNRLSDLGRREEALAAHEEAVRTLTPFFLRRSAVFADWMETMVRNYRDACQAAGREPDGELLAPLR